MVVVKGLPLRAGSNQRLRGPVAAFAVRVRGAGPDAMLTSMWGTARRAWTGLQPDWIDRGLFVARS